MSRAHEVSQILVEIRTEMQVIDLWAALPPSDEALASSQPFCIDTMEFSQWVQWLLIPRLEQMIERELPLPQNSQIHPMAEEVFKQLEEDSDRLLKLIEQLDSLLSTTRH